MTVVSKVDLKSVIWHKGLAFVLAFWIGSSLFLDFVIMPSLFAAGMMTQPDFASVGYGIFWIFNRLELLCAALVATAVFAKYQFDREELTRSVLAIVLLLSTIACTYFLAPQMSSLGLNLNWFEPATVPSHMSQLHMSYWLVEACKLAAATWLLRREI